MVTTHDRASSYCSEEEWAKSKVEGFPETGSAKPKACWAGSDEAGVLRLVLPSEGKGCCVVCWAYT